jgi:hypothetical protein
MFCFHKPAFLLGKDLYAENIFMVMYNFVPPFREATFCGVPSGVFDKLGCAAGGKSLRNTALYYWNIFLFTTIVKNILPTKNSTHT